MSVIIDGFASLFFRYQTIEFLKQNHLIAHNKVFLGKTINALSGLEPVIFSVQFSSLRAEYFVAVDIRILFHCNYQQWLIRLGLSTNVRSWVSLVFNSTILRSLRRIHASILRVTWWVDSRWEAWELIVLTLVSCVQVGVDFSNDRWPRWCQCLWKHHRR